MIATITNTQALVLTLGLAFLWLLPYVIDLFASYRRDGKVRDGLIKPLLAGKSISELSDGQLKEVTTFLKKEPEGLTGLVRSLLALIVLTIAGVALFFTLSSQTDAELRKTIVTAILAILGTIAGFYFGSKSMQDAAAASLQTVLGGPGLPTVSSVDLTPPTVQGGVASQVKVTLSAPAPMGGCLVVLSSNDTHATPPPSLSIAAGATSAAGPVTTLAVPAPTRVTITATVSGAQVGSTGTLELT
jgi:hypothetical protein